MDEINLGLHNPFFSESDVEEADVEDVHELREETINDVEDGNVRGVEEEALIVMEETNEEKVCNCMSLRALIKLEIVSGDRVCAKGDAR